MWRREGTLLVLDPTVGQGGAPFLPPKFSIFDLQKAYFCKLLSAKNFIYNQMLSKTRTHGMHSVLWLTVDVW